MNNESGKGSSALEREADRVEGMTKSQDHGGGDSPSDQAKKGQTNESMQDARVKIITQQAKEVGTGSKEPAKDLNKDG